MAPSENRIRKGKRLSPEDRSAYSVRMAEKYEIGWSIRQIAAFTGRSYGSLRTMLLEYGVLLRGNMGNRG